MDVTFPYGAKQLSHSQTFEKLIKNYLIILFLISGLEKDLESQKEESKKKLETLESQMTQVTADLATLKENDKNEELSSKITALNSDLDQKLSSAESNLEEFRAAFEKFQSETLENQSVNGKKIEDVDSQIKGFMSSSQGSVQDVMSDAESLKVTLI